MKRVATAALLLLLCSSLFSQSAMDYYNRGYQAHQDKDWNTSYTNMGYAINGLTGENLSKAHWYRAWAAFALENFEEAASNYVYCFNHNYSKSWSSRNAGASYERLKNYKQAAYYYRIAVEAFRNEGEESGLKQATKLLANSYKEIKDYGNAVIYYSQAVTQGYNNEDLAALYFSKGWCEFELKRYYEAIASYRQCLLNQPGYPSANYNIGAAYHTLEDYQNAVTYYRKGISDARAAGNEESACALLKRIAAIQYEQLQQYDEAIKAYTEIVNSCTDTKVKNDAYFDRARVYYSNGNYAGSIADNTYVLNVLTESRWASYNLALAYEMNDNIQKAIEHYGVALDGYVRDGDLEGASVILQRRGDLYTSIEDYQAAVKDFEKSLEYKPDNKYVAQRYEEVLPMAGGKGALKTVTTDNNEKVVNNTNNTNNNKYEKKTRPTITILEPAVSRGLKVIHRDDMLQVRGKAEDVSGISEVIVNNIFATIESSGEFLVYITLEPGDNTIFVTATNNNGYSTQEVFTVEKAGSEIRTESTEKRVALIIGNSAYTDSPLPNPVNDANLMAKTLESLGFEVFKKLNVADDDEMKKAVREFGVRIRDGGVGLFYYAGHGIQVNGKNYLIPTRAQINKEPDVEYEGIDVNMVMAEMDYARNRMNIVVLDACRNNPFARSFRSASRGLAQVDAPAGSYIAYSTAPGEVASDGSSANSPFTAELSKAMNQPGLTLEQVFKKVRTGVRKQTNGLQIPWTSSSIEGEFYFVK